MFYIRNAFSSKCRISWATAPAAAAGPKPTINKGHSNISSYSSLNLISWVFPLEKLCNLVLEQEADDVLKRRAAAEVEEIKKGNWRSASSSS